ncbi:GNAT family N-acetyltransferase [Aliiroseovarius subalbicans]|uniref:GNAT family N-acetyltransferase n=1 Tax=Aliiroseovarius subalbicans TaxID=2925840 RepID=UPI001F56472E|nr:GNAT family N-acetyltransferase [Aliiroseovarius subalbicans]MCI2398733.1 GNAT family N-acetyltransferase [Aliiroseovarius subalbicans]
MPAFTKGRYSARLAVGQADVEAAQALRHRCFVAPNGAGDAPGLDVDDFDPLCLHMLVEDRASGRLVCCFRLLPLSSGRDIAESYSAQHYDLSALAGFSGPMAEMGRFCIAPETRDPDIPRVAWGALTRFVDGEGIEMLFGCSSFAGTQAQTHRDAFALLGARHLAPTRWRPTTKAPKVVRFADKPSGPDNPKRAIQCLPPLLRTYLLMGGWVSDHAVIDDELNTMHVFTGLEIAAVPPTRARLLRAVAGRL